MKTIAICAVAILAATAPAPGKVQTKAVLYQHGDTVLEGYLAWDDSVAAKRPGVLVVHEWWGLNDYARSRAKQLAELGYVAFALDMYGEGKVTEHPQEAAAFAQQVRANVKEWQGRALAGLNVLRQHERVDSKRIAAIGYCFGGATVLQLAYAGTDLAAVVSFHGSLPVPTEEQAEQIKARMLVCHGAADAFIPEEHIHEFRTALEQAGADYQMIYYAGARHSFTNPAADGYGVDGVKYDKAADERSWEHMKMLFREVLSAP